MKYSLDFMVEKEKMNLVIVILTTTLFTTASTQSCVSPTTACSCYVEPNTLKKVITCRYKNLNTIPAFSPSAETYDRIEFTSVEATGTCPPTQQCNNITQLGTDAFLNLRVKEIDLRRNAISSFDVNAFRGLENILESLLIEGNGAVPPPYSALSVLQVLQSLHLEHFDQVEFNGDNTQLQFTSLTSLTITKFKNLTQIRSAAFQNLPNVETFKLQELHKLVSLPVLAILSFSNLKTLELYETGVTGILGESFKGLSLTSLEIKSNPDLTLITSTAFDGVSSTIKFLSLFQNDLSNFDFLSQTAWPQLTQLNIGYNFALVSSGNFATMPSLSYLTMEDMSLQSISQDMFTGLSNLHTLYLGFNRIKNIPADVFQNAPNLVDLRLNNQNENDVNSLVTIDSTAFVSIENSLQHLFVEKNKFDVTEFWDKIGRFPNLIELNIAELSLSSIPNYAFRNNTKLETIDLSLNNISSVQQETFFGPRDTLQKVFLNGNQIQTVDKCVLSAFPTQPEIYLTGNPLQCDCQLIWLYNWVQTDPSLAYSHVGQCETPASLKYKYFVSFDLSDLVCSPGYQEPTCSDLYSTTTTTTTTTTVTTTPTTPTPTTRPTPSFSVTIVHIEATKMTVTWSVLDRTFVTEYKLEIIRDGAKTIQLINKDETEIVLDDLRPETFYQFCLILQIEGQYREADPSCAEGSTLAEVTEPPVGTTAAPESQVNIPVIVGSIVGGVILVALIIIIIFFIMKSKKPKKRAPMTEPVSFAWRAEIPQAGGTAKRHAKKPDKGTSPDDITVNVISNGDMNTDRMSAGSYQHLKENDPRAVNTKPMPSAANGHYVNSMETRPLPRMPYGERSNHHGYVNDGFHSGGATNFPETSLNQYSEVVN